MIRSLSSAAALAALGLVAGCVNASDNPLARCTVDSDCGSDDLYCYRGFCIPTGRDAGLDGGMDAPPPTDDVPMTPDTGVDAPIVPPDGGCPRVGESCDTSMAGVCSTGTITCMSPAGECTRMVDPTPEACDRNDNDCDGSVDEDTDRDCYTGTVGCTDNLDGTYTCLGICHTGTQACNDGVRGSCLGDVLPVAGPDGCSAPGSPAVDDDCDGMIDEDCACTEGEMVACYAGPEGTAGTGRCVAGMLTCTGGSFGACVGEMLPEPESCENAGDDDDCNGIDDDVPGTGVPCSTGGMGVCADGVMTCMGTAVACVGPTATPEICDSLNNDCDAFVDEGFFLDSDVNNCGMCGRQCGSGRTCCDGGCVSTDSDDLNCGDCGTTCSGARSECCGGDCHEPTDGECTGCGTTNCAMMGLDCCPPACVDFDNDPSNCGGCGASSPDFICGSGERCCAGECVGDSDLHCGSCDACAGDEQCCGSGAAAECELDADPTNCRGCGVVCGAGQTCCGSGCANLMTSTTNCGTCGMACTTGQICSMGLCCPAGQYNSGGICCPTGSYNSGGICCVNGLTNCGGTCRNLQDDRTNCGVCGRTCGVLCCRGACAALCL